MKLLEVTTAHPETGEHHLDPNKIVELAIKLLAVVAAIIAMRATNQATQNAQKIQGQQHFLRHQFVGTGVDSNYVERVQSTIPTQQRRK